MRVAVDQTGRDDFAGRVDSLPRSVSALDLRAWSNRDDAALGDRDAAVSDNAARLVHRDDRATENQQIDRLPASLGGDMVESMVIKIRETQINTD